MPATGYIQVHTYSSKAQLPLKDVAISVTGTDGTAIAMELTDRNGRIEPIPIPVPDRTESQTPGSAEPPFSTVSLHARLSGYEQIQIDGLQIFADTVTEQNLEFIPLSEFPGSFGESERFSTPPQNL